MQRSKDETPASTIDHAVSARAIPYVTPIRMACIDQILRGENSLGDIAHEFVWQSHAIPNGVTCVAEESDHGLRKVDGTLRGGFLRRAVIYVGILHNSHSRHNDMQCEESESRPWFGE